MHAFNCSLLKALVSCVSDVDRLSGSQFDRKYFDSVGLKLITLHSVGGDSSKNGVRRGS